MSPELKHSEGNMDSMIQVSCPNYTPSDSASSMLVMLMDRLEKLLLTLVLLSFLMTEFAEDRSFWPRFPSMPGYGRKSRVQTLLRTCSNRIRSQRLGANTGIRFVDINDCDRPTRSCSSSVDSVSEPIALVFLIRTS